LIEGETAINRATLQPVPSLLTAHDEAPTRVDSDPPEEGHDEGPDQRPEPIRVASVLVLLRRRYVVIVTATLGAAAVALGLTLSADKSFEAATSVLVATPATTDSDAPELASESAAREVAANLELIELRAVKESVNDRLREPFTGSIDVTNDEEQSSLARITITDSDPERAARVANLWAREYIALRNELARERIADQRAVLKDAQAGLPPGLGSEEEAAALQERLDALSVASIAPIGVRQIDRAEPPAEASSPKPVQNAVIGAIVGLALGLALAIALERRDRRVRDPRFIEYVLGGPIIGRIPRSRALARSGRGTRALPAPEAEAFRTVRVNLRRQLEQQGTRSLIVTSAIPGEGKTTLAWNLARIEAASGSRVLLVEADLRRPSLAKSLEANGAAGLSDLLASDQAQLQDLIQPVDFADGADQEGERERGAVDVLFAGSPPANPAELLDSERMQAILEVIPDRYDLVIVDTSPTVVSDAMPILDYVGGVIVVGRLGLSTDESLIGLREQLDHLHAPTLGVVVNGDVPGLASDDPGLARG
jgi:polysaccharide biosynthesis transport protein